LFSLTRRPLIGRLALLGAAVLFVFNTVDIAATSIQFDLTSIGRSVYEAHARNGKWPERVEDLAGTEYLNMPHRKSILDRGQFVIVWQQKLDPNPDANRDRVLAFDNASLLSRFGRVWVCRGDLRVERLDADELNELLQTIDQ